MIELEGIDEIATYVEAAKRVCQAQFGSEDQRRKLDELRTAGRAYEESLKTSEKYTHKDNKGRRYRLLTSVTYLQVGGETMDLLMAEDGKLAVVDDVDLDLQRINTLPLKRMKKVEVTKAKAFQFDGTEKCIQLVRNNMGDLYEVVPQATKKYAFPIVDVEGNALRDVNLVNRYNDRITMVSVGDWVFLGDDRSVVGVVGEDTLNKKGYSVEGDLE
jgi:hypothetical protein